jgi:outer membrane lipoprotein LolB
VRGATVGSAAVRAVARGLCHAAAANPQSHTLGATPGRTAGHQSLRAAGTAGRLHRHGRIDLSAPLGFGAAHIEQTAQTLQLTTSKGLTLDSEAASDELRTTLGFEPPLASLRFWILGASDPATSAQQSLDRQQRLARLEQGGWQVDYGEYAQVQQQWLPRRLTVTRGALRLRVVIDNWQL